MVSATRSPGARGRLFVHLWDWPIRIMHWLAASCIVVLVVTGFYIGKPYFFVRADEPRFVMGWMRMLHFGAAGLLVATGIVRVYMLFTGNRFERITALVPHRVRDWRNLLRQAVYYATFGVTGAPAYVGHNPMQALSYLGLYAVVAVMVATGFALYGLGDPSGFFGTTFGWIHDVLGGSPNTRFVHHVLTWVFLVFVPVHVYLSLRADVAEEPGMISSMISGGRWIPDEEHEDVSRADLRALSEPIPWLRASGIAAVGAGLAGGLVFAGVQALVTAARGGRVWPPQDAIGSIVLGAQFVTTSETVPGWVLAFVGLFTHGVLSIVFGILLALAIHRLGAAAALVLGLAFGLGLFLVNAAALAATVVAVPVPWNLLPAHLAFGLVAAAVYKGLQSRWP